MKNVIIQLYPSGSYGDDAMVLSLFEQIGLNKLMLYVAEKKMNYPGKDYHFSRVFHPIKSKKLSWIVSFVLVLKILWFSGFKKTNAYLIGADVVDGYYGMYYPSVILKLIKYLSNFNFTVTLVGSSFSVNGNEEVARELSSLSFRRNVRICIRDKNSLSRLMQIAPGKYKLVADVAALLLPTVGKNIDYVRCEDSFNIGLNVGLKDCMKGWSTERIADQLKLWCNLSQRKITVVCIPHDVRGNYGGDLEPLLQIKEHLEGFPIDVVFPKIEGAKDAKLCVSMLDVVVTRRMHLAVAALSCGVKVIGIGYANKFEGQFNHYAQEKFVVQDFGEIVSLLENIYKCRDFRIDKNVMNNAIEMARGNLVN